LNPVLGNPEKIILSKNTLSPILCFRDFMYLIFTFSLKKEYFEKVDSDINEGIIKFGLMDDGYWKLIRHNALKYWLEWDRNKIFDIEEI